MDLGDLFAPRVHFGRVALPAGRGPSFGGQDVDLGGQLPAPQPAGVKGEETDEKRAHPKVAAHRILASLAVGLDREQHLAGETRARRVGCARADVLPVLIDAGVGSVGPNDRVAPGGGQHGDREQAHADQAVAQKLRPSVHTTP